MLWFPLYIYIYICSLVIGRKRIFLKCFIDYMCGEYKNYIVKLEQSRIIVGGEEITM